MGDYWLEHPEELKGQPKKTIIEYARKNGVLTAQPYESFQDALAHGKRVFVRSELAQDYNGISGLLFSRFLLQLGKVTSEEQLKDLMLEMHGRYGVEGAKSDLEKLETLCLYTNQDIERVRKAISYSFWEYIPGFNRVIVADSAIKARYHITTTGMRNGLPYYNYCVLEDGKVVKSYFEQLTELLLESNSKLIDCYEQVRHLDKFDPGNCAMMEWQTSDNNYLLQYMRGQQFSHVQPIERPPNENEVEAMFVRGGIEEKTVKMLVNWPRQALDADYEGFYGVLNGDPILLEVLSRRSDVYGARSGKIENWLGHMVINHKPRSLLLKPKLSFLADIERIFPSDEMVRLWAATKKTGEPSYVDFKIVADGNKAYISRIS